jgi:hypothetical protein
MGGLYHAVHCSKLVIGHSKNCSPCLWHRVHRKKAMRYTVVSGQINPNWGSLQDNHMSTSSKTNNLICSF